MLTLKSAGRVTHTARAPEGRSAIGTVLAGFFATTAAVVGCSASGADANVDEYTPTHEQKPTDPATNSAKLPPPKNGASSSSTSSSGSDGEDPFADAGDAGTSTTSDSGAIKTDAGATSSKVTGDSCTTIDEKYSKVCGKCGAQQALCVSLPDGTSGVVSDYGPCSGESGVCATGTAEPCGNCGTKTCGNTCGWGTCQNQGVCKKGVVQHDTAGCPTPGTFRSQTCTDTCGWGSFSSCSEPLVVLPAVGDTSSTVWELKTDKLGQRPSSCKRTASLVQVTVFPVPVKNPTDREATVSVWNSSAGTNIDTTIFTYLRDTAPTSNDDYKACYTESIDNCVQLGGICDDDGLGDWAGVDNIKIPAHSTVVVVTAGYYATSKGKFVLNVKTKSN